MVCLQLTQPSSSSIYHTMERLKCDIRLKFTFSGAIQTSITPKHIYVQLIGNPTTEHATSKLPSTSSKPALSPLVLAYHPTATNPPSSLPPNTTSSTLFTTISKLSTSCVIQNFVPPSYYEAPISQRFYHNISKTNMQHIKYWLRLKQSQDSTLFKLDLLKQSKRAA